MNPPGRRGVDAEDDLLVPLGGESVLDDGALPLHEARVDGHKGVAQPVEVHDG